MHVDELVRLRRVRDRIDREYSGITEQLYGVRDCALRDPAGNMIGSKSPDRFGP